MVKIISVCSGKGGVGKTSVAINTGAALSSLNKRVVVADFNMTTSHIGLMLGFYSAEKTLNSFLRGESKLEDALHAHPSGLMFLPAALELHELSNLETHNIKEHIRQVFASYDFFIIDSAPGIGREALISLKSCDDAMFVANPYIPSVVDVLKTKSLSSKIGFQNLGVVINKVSGKKYELSSGDIFRFTELPVIAIVPHDEAILKSSNTRKIPFFENPKSSSSRAFTELAHKIAGMPYRR